MDTDTITSHADIWQMALAELKLQMTKGTFNAWLKSTYILESENGTFQVAVGNGYIKEWLDARLRSTVERTLFGLMKCPVDVEFVVVSESARVEPDDVEPEPEPAASASGQSKLDWGRVADFDPSVVGWTPFSNYAAMFWAPLLGRVAWPLYLRIRSDDKRSASKKSYSLWTPQRRYYAPKLAREIGCGKQAIIGTWRKCKPDSSGVVRCDDEGLAELTQIYPDLEGERLPPMDGEFRRRQVGALRKLSDERTAQYERQGKEPHVFYVVSVLVKLPLLTPGQVSRLPALLVTKHDRWIWEHTEFDPLAWSMRDL